MEKFNPDDIGIANGNYFGFPFNVEESKLVLISVPWDVTVSYGQGTALAPEAIIEASLQVEILDYHNPQGWEKGIATQPIDPSILSISEELRPLAQKVIEHLEQGGSTEDDAIKPYINKINQHSAALKEQIKVESTELLDQGKIVGLVGGDHSTPLGLIEALGEKYSDWGILHLDAHADLREAYEGFEYSHASIMFNALKCPTLKKLVQVGIRDYCYSEKQLADTDSRIAQFGDYQLKTNEFEGKSWQWQCQNIVEQLPQRVYISFDIDALSADLCPNTGTPVVGGLSFHQAVYLIYTLVKSKREIIGFDLTEVSPDAEGSSQWDANVGARVLYKLCNFTLI